MIFILLCLVGIIFLSQLIFDIDVITNDHQMEKIILKELKNSGIEKYKFKKNYQEIQTTKKNILNKYRSKIDWIEIESEGTKYIVRYEPRIENQIKKQPGFRDIIAKKDAVIYKLDVSDGEIIKYKDNYVHKGDIIVSGYIHLNDQIKKTVSATGKVYGEVWYTLTINFPLDYYRETKTGKKKNIYSFKILNKDIELFNWHKYKTKSIKNKTILKNNLLPFKLVKQTQYETKVIDRKYNAKEALKQAIKEGKKKIKKQLKKDEFIIDYKVLDQELNNRKLKVKIFYTVCEDITAYQNIEEYKEEDKDETNS